MGLPLCARGTLTLPVCRTAVCPSASRNKRHGNRDQHHRRGHPVAAPRGRRPGGAPRAAAPGRGRHTGLHVASELCCDIPALPLPVPDAATLDLCPAAPLSAVAQHCTVWPAQAGSQRWCCTLSTGRTNPQRQPVQLAVLTHQSTAESLAPRLISNCKPHPRARLSNNSPLTQLPLTHSFA